MKEMKQRRKKERTWAEAARLVRPGGRPGRGRGGSAVPQGLPAASGPSPSNGAGGAAIVPEGVKAGAGTAWRARAVLPVPRPVPRLPAVPPPAAMAEVFCTVVFFFLLSPVGSSCAPGRCERGPRPSVASCPPSGGPRGLRRLPPGGAAEVPGWDAGGAVPQRFNACRAGLRERFRSFSYGFKAPWEEPEPAERARPLSKVSGLITEGAGSFCAPAAPEGRWRVPGCRSSSWTEYP